MKQLKQWLWLAGLLINTSNLVAAQNTPKQKEQQVKDNPISAFKISLSLNARGAYDLKNYDGTPDFGPATIPMTSDADNRKRALFDISSAVLSIEKKLSIPQGEIIKLVAQTNLNKALALKSVYADFRGFRVGKALTNFCDPDACDLVGGRPVQVRWEYKLHPLLSSTVAIEAVPDFVIYPEIKKEKRDKEALQPYKNIPALSANVRYEREKLWHIQVSGLFSPLEYYDKNTKLDTITTAWGINMGASMHLVPEKTIFKIQGVYGQGIGNYIADLGDLEKEVNTVYIRKDKKSTCETLSAGAVGIGIEHKWMSNLSSGIAYRLVNTERGDRNDDAYKYGHAASCDLFYHPTEQIKIGAEYLWGVRKNLSENWKDAHRIQAVVGFEL